MLSAGAPTGGDRRRRIVVAGATGTVGRRTVSLLAARHEVSALTRDPARAARAGLAGRIVGADNDDRPGLVRACVGADALFVITGDPLRLSHDENLLAAARTAGVRHVVKLSALAVTDPRATDAMTRRQRECEEMVRTSGMDWTLLRPRAFMSNALGWAPGVRRDGAVRALYGTSRNACVDPEDVAKAAAVVLTTPGHHRGAYALTGPEALSARDQTDRLASALELPLRFVELTLDQAREAWRRRFSEQMVQALTESAARQAAGAKLQVTHDLERLVSRPARTFGQWAKSHVADFRRSVRP
ncbi:NAD(P)H-binding protein (plasmid) [Streptomyces sp. NBC_00190]|uniref:NAD(P)H-binding protein n=1 Tax=unclassified Streptomyces TaxID=2593676 RepID=UPI002E292279|nr:NAD(P)H-binding protein [Streptomyces sp. NBC_00190]